MLCAGKTAYAVASTKGVRDAFRRYMAAAPQQWDWAAADVPSALTPEMDQHQQAKEVAPLVAVDCYVDIQISLGFRRVIGFENFPNIMLNPCPILPRRWHGKMKISFHHREVIHSATLE